MPALALILHVAEGDPDGARGFGSSAVQLASAQRAAALVDFYDQHARRVYGPELQRLTSPRAALAAKIKAGAVRDGDTLRDIARHQWSGLKTTALVEQAAAALVDVAWVRIEDRPGGSRGGRPSRVLRVHPALRDETA
jgi:hypothetical protein